MDYSWMVDWLWAAVLILCFCTGWVLTLFTLPGNWLMVVAAALYAFLLPGEQRTAIGWGIVIALFVLAAVGELLELAAGAMGAARKGGSKRAAVLAIVLSVPGALIGAVVGSVVPLVGTVAGTIICAGLGAFAGAMLGEAWKGRSFNESWGVGRGAFWGRILGTAAKVGIGSVMLVVGTLAVLLE